MKFITLAVLPISISLIFLSCLPRTTPLQSDPPNFFLSERFLNIAHSGGEALAPSETLAAFKNALNHGADALEMDVHATADGVVVLRHDPTVDSTTNGTGYIKEMTFSELKALDAGYHFTRDHGRTYPFRGQGITIPSLGEVFQEFPEQYFMIEIKQTEPSIVDEVLHLIGAAQLQKRVILACASDYVLEEIRRKAPAILTSFGFAEILALYALTPEGEVSYVPPTRILHIPPDRDLLEKAKRFDIKTHVWTINDAKEMRDLLRQGVDGIMTDDPATLNAILHEQGLR